MTSLRALALSCLCALCALPACGGDPDLAAAAATLERFQQALQRGDRAACRELVTEASAEALPELPWHELRTRPQLRVLGAERTPCDLRVQVEDPGDGGKRSWFVVVRERGRLVVDLVATAGLHVEAAPGAPAQEAFVPRPLTGADFERIRRYGLSQPVR
ncbi:MAG: hypothetical protein FJ265_10775 [Planctomycetes bacterium]|nr:hypothetical protein [Planctomycetota bacterium]